MFDFPPLVDDLADVPVEFQPAYRATEGGFELARAVRRAQAKAQAKARKETGETLAAKDARVAELELKERENRERNRKLASDLAIKDALKLAGVKPGLRKSAALALAGDVRLVFDETEGVRVEVDTGFGRSSVAAATQAWLASEKGAAFNPPPVVKPERRYGRAMDQLRALLK